MSEFKVDYKIGVEVRDVVEGTYDFDLSWFLDEDYKDKYHLEEAIRDNLCTYDILDAVYRTTGDRTDSWWVGEPKFNIDEVWEMYLKLRTNE